MGELLSSLRFNGVMLDLGPVSLQLPRRPPFEGFVLLDGSRVVAVGERSSKATNADPLATDPGTLVTPGLIDLQVNGGLGLDLTAEPEAIWKLAARLPQYGVTAFLPTLISCPEDRIRRAIETLRNGPPSGFRGATPLGLHLEGPFLNPEKRGAHDKAMLRLPADDPNPFWLEEPAVRMVTLAPELAGGRELISKLLARNIVVSVGHSNADWETMDRTFSQGVLCGTHLYNAMTGFDHRNPGVAPALLLRDGVTTGLIADGVHSHPALVDLAWRVQGSSQIFLVSDAVAGSGMKPGVYSLADQKVTVDKTAIRLADGTLAGSTAMLATHLFNLIRWTGCTLGDALPTVTETPARVLGEVRGRLVEGGLADLTLFDDTGVVVACIVGGEVLYRREK